MKIKEEKDVTINDIAKACGVSKTTISRYLNKKYEFFSEETRERISKVISEMGYSPNLTAQRLKSARSRLIGCSIGDMSSPFAGLLLQGITSVFQDTGYQVLFVHCGNDSDKEKKALEGLLANKVDGLIVNTSGGNDEYLLSIANSGVPVVLADRGLLGLKALDTVELNNEETAYECVRILKDFGYERIAYFTQRLGNISPRVNRYKGYCRAMNDFFPGIAPKLAEVYDDCTDGWISAIKEFRDSNPGVRIAALTSNGEAAQNMVLAYMEMGEVFGRDFGLFSFDDWKWMMLTQPGITSVAIPTEIIGAKSAELLLKQIESGNTNHSPISIKLDGKINIRGSTTAK